MRRLSLYLKRRRRRIVASSVCHTAIKERRRQLQMNVHEDDGPGQERQFSYAAGRQSARTVLDLSPHS